MFEFIKVHTEYEWTKEEAIVFDYCSEIEVGIPVMLINFETNRQLTTSRVVEINERGDNTTIVKTKSGSIYQIKKL